MRHLHREMSVVNTGSGTKNNAENVKQENKS